MLVSENSMANPCSETSNRFSTWSPKSGSGALRREDSHGGSSRGCGDKVNAADLGYVATDMKKNHGVRSVEQGAATPVRLATLPPDGPTGGCCTDRGAISW